MNGESAPPLWKRTLNVLKILTAAALLGALFEYFGIPAGMLFGSAIGAALVNQSWFPWLKPAEFPPMLRRLGLLSAGIASGVLLTTGSLMSTATVALPIVGVYLALTAANLLLITFLMSRYGVDPATAVMAVTPGGLAEMLSMAADKNAEISIVLTVHSVRLFTLVLLILPIMLVVVSP